MTPLSQITTVVFPMYPVSGGAANMQMVMSQTDPAYPNAGKYQLSGSGVLVLSDDGPALLSDLELSQLEQTSAGAPALDDISFQLRDVTSYTGTVDGTGQSEDFSLASPPTTFFTVFFSDTIGFLTKKFPLNVWFVRYAGDGVTLLEISYIGHYDPNYKPQTGQLISSAMTSEESLNEGAVRTFKTVELGAMLQSVLMQSTLNLIGHDDCILGAGWMGFMYQPPATSLLNGYYNGIFTGGTVNQLIMQATPYQHLFQWPGTNVYNAVGSRPAGRSTFWPNKSLNWDSTHPEWFGPSGTWWISLGTLFTKIAASFGQIYATDGSVSSGGSSITSLSGQFSASLVGKTIHFSKPLSGGSGSDTIASVSGSTIVTLTSTTFAANGNNLYWWIEGDADQQVLFDETGQLGAGSAVATNSLQILAQIPDNANFCYPVDVSRGQIIPKDIYISVNGFLGSHPYDGSLWNSPLAFGLGMKLSDVLQGLCNFLCCEYSVIPDITTGQGTLTLNPVSGITGTFPDWTPIGDFTEQEPSSSALAVTVNNPGGVTVLCPYSSQQSVQNFPVPVKLHAWGQAVHFTSDMLFVGSTVPVYLLPVSASGGGAATVTAQEMGLVFDGTTAVQGQAEECFKVVWFDSNGAPQINPNCWKGLAYAMFKDLTNTNIMYPASGGLSNPLQTSGGWFGYNDVPEAATAAFYALGAQYPPSGGATANETNMDRFNSIDFQAVVFGTFKVPTTGTVLQRDFLGTADSNGKLSTVNVGLTKQWLYDGKERSWRLSVFPRYLLTDVTIGTQWTEVPFSEYFPDITSLRYGVQPGSANSSSAGTGGSGYAGGSTATSLTFGILSVSYSSTQNNLVIPPADIVRITSTVTGPISITGIANGAFFSGRVTFVNVGTNVIIFPNQDSGSTAANRLLLANGDVTLLQDNQITLFYDTTTLRWREII